MHCTKKISDNLIWVGADDRRLAMFEGVYSVPYGVSYNSYLLIDEKTVLFDTVDKAVRQRFLENVNHALGGRQLDYIVVQHMEPDHSAALEELIVRYPSVKIVCNEKTLAFIEQFFSFDARSRALVVKQSDTLSTGSFDLHFIMAPMVHWPEVMVTYESKTKTLFSADAFGCFGALNGALFADEVDFNKDYMGEARRYYTNIVGKYGPQVKSLLGKAATLEINMICPLHGFVWRRGFGDILGKYALWSSYEPEEHGVLIAYASVYGNTENASEILACALRAAGVKTAMYDVSVTPASEILSEAFRRSHLVFASTTYNAGIFVTMEALIHDLTAHNIQNRAVAIIENGSWAPSSGGLIREKLEGCKNITFIGNNVTLKSSVKDNTLKELNALADAIIASMPAGVVPGGVSGTGTGVSGAAGSPGAGASAAAIDPMTMFKLSYGLFVLTAKDGGKDNGCIINTAAQVTSSPNRISVTVNKSNYTHDMIAKTGEFNITILSQSATFDIFKQFGFQSGKDTDKFAAVPYGSRTANGIRYIPICANGVISAKVSQSIDCLTHTLFIADVTEAAVLSGEPSVTYQYYFDNIKPKPQPAVSDKKKYVCKICGYEYDGSTLPDDYICPLCKHGAEDFELI